MNGLFSSIWYPALRHVWRLATRKHYLTRCFLYSRYGWKPRYQETRLRLHGLNLVTPDAASLLFTYDEIFNEQIYRFESSTDCPRILDLGANVGLSVLYFKRIFPNAEITAFEADPKIFGYLERNVHVNGFRDVQLINKAVWDCDCTLRFQSEGADGGQISVSGENGAIEVPAMDIRTLLQEKSYHFIKIDIEGGECRVVPRCAGLLDKTERFFVEYHSRVGEQQCLDAVIRTLSEAGFRLHIQSVGRYESPMIVGHEKTGAFDMQLNIFGRKP